MHSWLTEETSKAIAPDADWYVLDVEAGEGEVEEVELTEDASVTPDWVLSGHWLGKALMHAFGSQGSACKFSHFGMEPAAVGCNIQLQGGTSC